jgi:hypothetical protein
MLLGREIKLVLWVIVSNINLLKGDETFQLWSDISSGLEEKTSVGQ